MTVADRQICRTAMRQNLLLENFVGQRIEFIVPTVCVRDLAAEGAAWDACKRAYEQGLKDAYLVSVENRDETELFRTREDNALAVLFRSLKREINKDYVDAAEVDEICKQITTCYRQGFAEGKLPLGALAL